MLLLFSDGQEVAVVYFRNGYMPQNYISEQVILKSLILLLVVLVTDYVKCSQDEKLLPPPFKSLVVIGHGGVKTTFAK